MTEQRNFRSAYLEKVGIKGVEEKKSLEILLNEQPLDIIKLNQFCIRFPVPASHRSYLWKVLLGTVDLIIAQYPAGLAEKKSSLCSHSRPMLGIIISLKSHRRRCKSYLCLLLSMMLLVQIQALSWFSLG